jgi:hypothetical protein
MSPDKRNILFWIISICPVSFLVGCINIIKFLATLAANLVQERHLTGIPAPTKVLLANASLAAAIPLFFALAFVVSLLWIARRSKDEADRLTWSLIAHTAVWFTGIIYFTGVLMAAMLPAFILNA